MGLTGREISGLELILFTSRILWPSVPDVQEATLARTVAELPAGSRIGDYINRSMIFISSTIESQQSARTRKRWISPRFTRRHVFIVNPNLANEVSNHDIGRLACQRAPIEQEVLEGNPPHIVHLRKTTQVNLR